MRGGASAVGGLRLLARGHGIGLPGLGAAGDGTLYALDSFGRDAVRVRKISREGQVSTIAQVQ